MNRLFYCFAVSSCLLLLSCHCKPADDQHFDAKNVRLQGPYRDGSDETDWHYLLYFETDSSMSIDFNPCIDTVINANYKIVNDSVIIYYNNERYAHRILVYNDSTITLDNVRCKVRFNGYGSSLTFDDASGRWLRFYKVRK